MISKKMIIVTLLLILFSCSKDNEIIIDDENIQGKNMLLIGNSFFRPYAEKLDIIATDAGLENHNSTIVMRGGPNGEPISFWNNSTSAEHQLIKSVLDQGNIDYFGMTYGNAQDNVQGYVNWIAYALQNNPNIRIFISIPPIDFPNDWEQLSQNYGFNSIQEFYEYFVDDIVHQNLVNHLRTQFPDTNIFTIPTGWATINLAQMQKDDLLLDDILLFGPRETSIFTDNKGHQGEIVRETGGLIWLNSIYNINLNTNNYITGFNSDLHTLARQITDNHNPNYRQ